MPGNYTHTSPGSTLTLTEYDNNHQNHIDKHDFDGLGDYSADTSEMQSTVDPGEAGSESLATSGAGELERLRYILQEQGHALNDGNVSSRNWYESPSLGMAELHGYKNRIINGQFKVNQRGSSIAAPNDDVYVADRWVALSDGNGVVDYAKTTSSKPTGHGTYARFTVNTANKKFGILQVLEADACEDLLDSNRPVSLSFWVRGSGTTKTRAAVIAWNGTTDTVTSDVVSAWGAEDTNPTLASNWTYENTPATLTVTSSWSWQSIENITIDTSNAKQVAVFIWSDDTTVAGSSTWDVGGVQLEAGLRATTYDYIPLAAEKARCYRFFHTSYDEGVAPGTSTNSGALLHRTGDLSGTGVSEVFMSVRYPTEMRDTPTVTVYSTTGASANMRNITDGADLAATTLSGGTKGTNIVDNGSATAQKQYRAHYTADAEL